METLATIARVEIVLFFCALGAVVVFKLLTGRINLEGLLDDKKNGKMSPERVQLLVFTLVAATFMLVQLGDMRASGEIWLRTDILAYLFGGSQAVYLLPKYWQFKLRQDK